MITVLVVIAALSLDAVWGEPRRYHPLVGFGRLTIRVESWLHGGDGLSGPAQRLRGGLAVALLLIPAVSLTAGTALTVFGPLLDALILYLTLGYRSLTEHAHRVVHALRVSDLTMARYRVGMMVSRDSDAMSTSEACVAAVESVLENGNDAVFGALFWYILGGAPGVVLYRLSNTLDAMWGYRNRRYDHFGWTAARLDDVLNYIPARLTALSYALCGRTRYALQCWRRQAKQWSSPNAGPVMAAGAGGLAVSLGGPVRYQGIVKQRPPLGCGRLPEVGDIERALALVRCGLMLWLVVLTGGWLLGR